MTLRTMAGRALTGSICIVSLAHVSALLPRFIEMSRGLSGLDAVLSGSLYVAFFSCLAGSALALVLVLRSWGSDGAQALAVFLAIAAMLWGIVLRIFELDISEGGIGGSGSTGLFDMVLLLFCATLSSAAFLRFSATFPRRLGSNDLADSGRSPVPIALRALLLRPWFVWTVGAAWPLVTIGVLLASVALSPDSVLNGMSAIPAVVALLAFPVTAMVAGASNLLVGYRASDPRDRGRILWLVAGVVTSAWMLLIPFGIFAVADTDRYLLGNLGFALWALAPGVLVSAVSVAMFYGGAVDPRLVLRRSTMLGIAGAVWIAVYAVLENSLAGWLVDSFGIPESIVSAGLALAAAAVALLAKRIGSSVLRNERSRHDEVVS